MLQHDPWALAAEARRAHRWRRVAADWNSVLNQALIDAADPQPDSLVLDVLKGVARVWNPAEVHEVEVLRRVLEQMQAAKGELRP